MENNSVVKVCDIESSLFNNKFFSEYNKINTNNKFVFVLGDKRVIIFLKNKIFLLPISFD